MQIRSIHRFLCGRCIFLAFVVFWFLSPTAKAQAPVPGPAAPTTTIAEEKPVVANVCPKFCLIATPRRIKLYGANLSGIQLKSEEDLIFSDYQPDPDSMSLTVTVEAASTARTGKRTLLLISSSKEMVQSLEFYILKREDKALLQKDLLRCPQMKEEPSGKPAKATATAKP